MFQRKNPGPTQRGKRNKPGEGYRPRLESLENRVLLDVAAEHFVGQLYHDLLGRAAGPAEAAFWANALASGTTRAQLARTIEGSQEYQTVVVQAAYGQFVHRSADPGG